MYVVAPHLYFITIEAFETDLRLNSTVDLCRHCGMYT